MIELLRAAKSFGKWLKRHTGLTAEAYEFLHSIRDLPSPTMGEVAKASELHPSSVTALVDSLEEANVLRRVRQPNDRRVIRLEFVNPEGFAEVEEMIRLTFGRLPDASYLAAYTEGMESVVPVYPVKPAIPA